MLTAITYNCTPDSLGDVSQEDFVDLFENEFYAKYGYASLTVTFDPAVRSGVTAWASDDYNADADLESNWLAHIGRLAEKAFNACLTA